MVIGRADAACRGAVRLYTMVDLCPQKLRKLGDCCRPPFNIIVEGPATEWPGF